MRVVVMTLAVLSAVAGALFSGRSESVQVQSEPSDIALFV
jgi:hypothetical protein